MFRISLSLMLLFALLGGALPVAASPDAAIHVTTTNDSLAADGLCSLREAIIAANTDRAVDACPAGTGADKILLPAGAYTLALEGALEDAAATGDLDILAHLQIQGAGRDLTIIDGGGLDRVFDLPNPDAHVLLDGLTVRGGAISPEAPDSDWFGAGIRSSAHLILHNVLVTANSNEDYSPPLQGGGIFSSGELELRDAAVNANRSDIARGAGVASTGVLRAIRSQINHNYSFSGAGGGLYNTGQADLRDSELLNNHFEIYDGYSRGGTFSSSGIFTCTRCRLGGSNAHEASVGANSGVLTLTDSVIEPGYDRFPRATDLESSGSLRLLRSTFSNGPQRGLAAWGEVWIQSCQFNQHAADSSYEWSGGGAILMHGRLTILDSRFDDNYTTGPGGALYGSGEWFIGNTSFSGNSAAWEDYPSLLAETSGGAIAFDDGRLELLNVTFSGNHADVSGGALLINGGQARLEGVTISGNEVVLGRGGGLAVTGGAVALRHTILAANTAPNDPDCFGSGLTSSGYNFVGISGCGWPAAPGDQLGTPASPLDPRLGPLANLGMTPQVRPLLPDSPALDAGAPHACLPLDARAVARPQGAACDIGAFEVSAAPAPLAITLDILPGVALNRLDPTQTPTFPAAILSTSSFFAPSRVNPASLRLGAAGSEASLVWRRAGVLPDCWFRDANNDQRLDLICRFALDQTGLKPGDTQATLTGLDWDGNPLAGQDAVLLSGPTGAVLLEPAALWEGDVLLWLPNIAH